MTSRLLLIKDEPGFGYHDHRPSPGRRIRGEFRHEREAGLSQALSDPFDVIILDVMLPKRDGYQVCRELRERGVDAAILMLTAKTQVVDRVTGTQARRR